MLVENVTTDREFWEFSFDEMAKFDTPAVIDYVQKQAQTPTVAYLGHSQGTVMMWATLSSIPKYNSIVKPFIAMAPCAYFHHISAPIKSLAYDCQ